MDLSAAEMVQIRTYATTRGMDPDDTQQFEQARTELREMTGQELADYTDGLRWNATLANDHALLSAAVTIDDPELVVADEDSIEQSREPSGRRSEEADSALRRTRTALTRDERRHRDCPGTGREGPGTDRDLSL